MRIIIALDIIGGKCVRLTRGDFNTKKVYNEDPLELALKIEANGIKFIHIVDLDGAKNKKIENIKVLEKIAGKTNLIIDFGGGIIRRRHRSRRQEQGDAQARQQFARGFMEGFHVSFRFCSEK